MTRRTALPRELLHSAFTTREAVEVGIGRGRLRGADLESPFRGVHVGIDHAASLELLCSGLAKRVTGEAFFVGVTAARLWGAPLPRWAESGPLHVGVFSGTAPTGRGLRGSIRDLEPHFVVTLRGHRVTTPDQTWIDLAGTLGMPDLVAVGDYFIHHARPLTTRSGLASAIERAQGRRGVKRARIAWDLLDERAESRKETHLRVLLTSHDLGPFEANIWIATRDGHRYRADLADRRRKVIIEYQSAFHHDPVRQQRDMVRRSRLQADGWVIIEVSQWDLDHPHDLLTRIRNTLALR